MKSKQTSTFKIKFVGKKTGKKPLDAFTDGNKIITLPVNQSRGFSHPEARAILQHAPDLYKRVARRK